LILQNNGIFNHTAVETSKLALSICTVRKHVAVGEFGNLIDVTIDVGGLIAPVWNWTKIGIV
jgi:hypothetical protein